MEALFMKRLIGIFLLQALLWSGVYAADCGSLEFELVDKRNFPEEIKSISFSEFRSHLFPLVKDDPSAMRSLLAVCSLYEKDLELAFELHKNTDLCNLIVTMKQEVAVISPEVLPGMSKIDIYIKRWSEPLAHQSDSSVINLYKRALFILADAARRDEDWERTLAFKKFIEEKSDDERHRYVKSEKERIHGISQLLQTEFDRWQEFCVQSGQRTRHEWRKKD